MPAPHETQAMLEEALRLGDLELQLLQAGEVDEAGAKAQQRGDLIKKALKDEHGNNAGVELPLLQDKLEQLMSLQGRLTTEARKLHESVRSELLRTKQEGVRHAGYGQTTRRNRAFSLHKRG